MKVRNRECKHIEKVLGSSIIGILCLLISCASKPEEGIRGLDDVQNVEHVLLESIKAQYEKYEILKPALEFYTVEGWEDLSNNWSDGYLKHHRLTRVRDGKIDGVIRVVRDIYTVPISSIDKLDSQEEKLSFQKEAPVENFTLKVIQIEGINLAEYRFEVNIQTRVNGVQRFRAAGFKRLIVEQGEEYILNFFLLTSTENFEEDYQDLKQMIFSLNLKNDPRTELKKVSFDGVNYTIPVPTNYSYYEHSRFSSTPMYEFALTECSPLQVFMFDVLVPTEDESLPVINIHSFNALEDTTLSEVDFMVCKDVWKGALQDGTVNQLFKGGHPLSPDCSQEYRNLVLDGYVVLEDEEDILRTLLRASIKDKKYLKLTDYLYINEVVIYLTYTLPFSDEDDLMRAIDKANSYTSNFKTLN
jgi:hypothetical protein